MEFKEVLNKRISQRGFENKEISDEVIMELLGAGHLAPSAKNRQPWRFKILKGEEKNQVAEKLIFAGKNPDPDEEIAKYGNTISNSGIIIKESSVLIIVYKNIDEKLWNKSDLMSIGASVQNIMLAAVDKKLGTLWLGDMYYVYDYLKTDDLDIVTAFVIGYPRELEYKYKRVRKPIEDVILKSKFNTK